MGLLDIFLPSAVSGVIELGTSYAQKKLDLEFEGAQKKLDLELEEARRKQELKYGILNILAQTAVPLAINAGTAYLTQKCEKRLAISASTVEQNNTPLAIEGQNVHELFASGLACFEGNGVPQDYAQAVAHFREAAEQNLAEAQGVLGFCYAEGMGVPQDYAQAVVWLKKAAEQGDDFAQERLGGCYFEGMGVPQDYAQAVVWLKKAAEQGNADAQIMLGDCYYDGNGVPQDYAQAVALYRKAAEQGNAAAQNRLGNCYYSGKEVSQDYAQAVAWYKKAAEQGNAAAQNNLGDCYYNGNGVPQDYEQAVTWFKKAAEQGTAIVVSQNRLGDCYFNGQGLQQNYTQAVTCYIKASEQNLDKVNKYYKQIAVEGKASALLNIGRCYYKGLGVQQNYTLAVSYFQKSAEEGNSLAKTIMKKIHEQAAAQKATQTYSMSENFYNTGLTFYEKGDYTTAMLYFEKAGSEGHEQAQKLFFSCKKKLV